MRVKLTLAYDGTAFAGWQHQPGLRTVQADLEAALAPFHSGRVVVTAAGRTDAGVHAAGQVVSFDLAVPPSPPTLARALNATLQPDIRVVEAAEASPDFNARHDAVAKTYRYLVWQGDPVPPLLRGFAWGAPSALDRAAMQHAADLLVGRHDFAGFQSAGADTASTVRRVMRSVWHALPAPAWLDTLAPWAGSGNAHTLLCYEVSGSGFLRHMVRAIVGTLVDVGAGRRPASDIERALQGGRRELAGRTAPAHGLTLWRVDY